MSEFIIRKNRVDRFTHLSNELLQDSSLSFKALGMLVYLLSLPSDWKLNMEHLAKKGKAKGKHGCGRDAVRSIVKELQLEGYLQIFKEREKGKFFRTVWLLNEEPTKIGTDSPQADFPLTVKPPKEKPTVENQPLQRIIHTKHCSNKLLLPLPATEVKNQVESSSNFDLILPIKIQDPERKSLLRAVSVLPLDQAQDVLDEAIALKNAGAVKVSLIGLTMALVKKAKAGQFNLAAGLTIQFDRKRREELKNPVLTLNTPTIKERKSGIGSFHDLLAQQNIKLQPLKRTPDIKKGRN